MSAAVGSDPLPRPAGAEGPQPSEGVTEAAAASFFPAAANAGLDPAPAADAGGEVTAALNARRRRARGALLILALALGGVMIISAGVGALKISPGQVVSILAQKVGLPAIAAVDPGQEALLLGVRFPRVVMAVLFGAALAVAGASIQGLFRNPLADPGLIGVSTGAALGAVAVIVVGAPVAAWLGPTLKPGLLPLAAFGGGLAATSMVWRLSQAGGRASVAALLLAGVAMNAFAGAGTGLFTFLATDAQLRNLTFWTLGSLGGATWGGLAISVPLLLIGLALLFFQRRALNALLLGEAEAGHLGFSMDRVKRLVVLGSALLVGVTVASAGVIGFIGLVVPHLLRLWIGPDHRTLLPGAALLGAILLSTADLVARTIAAPAEVPVGIVTALIGAPFFLWLLRRESGRI